MIETVCLAGQHSHPWGVMVDGMYDGDVGQFNTEAEAVAASREFYPNDEVVTSDDPRHYSQRD
jgi:hypothetical protein